MELGWPIADKFALLTDFRATQDNDLHGAGREHYSYQEIGMEITKEDTGTGEYTMYILPLPTLES